MSTPLSAQVPKEYHRNSGIYCLVCYPTGDTYIGETGSFYYRMSCHKGAAKNSPRTLYKRIREVGIENFQFEIISRCEDNSMRYLEERVTIRRQLPNLNTMFLPSRICQD